MKCHFTECRCLLWDAALQVSVLHIAPPYLYEDDLPLLSLVVSAHLQPVVLVRPEQKLLESCSLRAAVENVKPGGWNGTKHIITTVNARTLWHDSEVLSETLPRTWIEALPEGVVRPVLRRGRVCPLLDVTACIFSQDVNCGGLSTARWAGE